MKKSAIKKGQLTVKGKKVHAATLAAPSEPLARCARLANGALSFLKDMVTDRGASHMSKTTMAFLKVAITAVSEVRKSLEQEMSK